MLGPDCKGEHRYQVPYGSGGCRVVTGGSSGGQASALNRDPVLCCSSTSQRASSPCCAVVSSLLSSAGICVLVVSYTVLGAVTFMALEGQNQSPMPPPTPALPPSRAADHPGDEKLRFRTVERLWSITEDLNILYKDNWTKLAEEEVLKFQDILVRKYRNLPEGNRNRIWSFPSSFLYSLTLITTIGYGSVSPRTTWGRIMTVLYALIGIPLMLVYLSTIGDGLAKNIRSLYGRMNRSGYHRKTKKDSDFSESSLHNHVVPEKAVDVVSKEKPPDIKSSSVCSEIRPIPYDADSLQRRQRVPVPLTLSIVAMYISGGAFLFKRLENWTLLEGSYFCFTSLGTIGFGELIPGTADSNERVSVFVSSAYILVGMAVIAMCFNLVQDETVLLVRRVGTWMRKDDDLPEEDGEPITMSVVSS